ncbi:MULTISPECIES: hypothetical protein [unclassified Caballeronia]|uniref:hypothetical protein n=1 Tax=unclassified Caballeronia TaxID=2646786 RepID=UPI003ED12EBE
MPASREKTKRPSLATQSRRKRILFLPMERTAADQLSLQFHIALETLRRGQGDSTTAQCLVQVILLTGFLEEAGFGQIEREVLDRGERALSALIQRGKATGDWLIDDLAIDNLTIIVNEHDRQLRETRLQAVVHASERFNRLIEKRKNGSDSFELKRPDSKSD